jgi:hypothetical protein
VDGDADPDGSRQRTYTADMYTSTHDYPSSKAIPISDSASETPRSESVRIMLGLVRVFTGVLRKWVETDCRTQSAIE